MEKMLSKIRKNRKALLELLIGAIAGQILWGIISGVSNPTRPFIAKTQSPKKLLRIGVMTAQKYVDTRGCAAYQTWATYFNDSVTFYAGSDVRSHCNLPLVRLPVEDDDYPPQKKSFLMLKHMHENYGGSYEWFMRVDDDIYINGEKLKELLRQMDSSVPIYMGQAGKGNSKEIGHLHLDLNENYCMGGPGVVLSGHALKLLNNGNAIDDCLGNLLTSHEDIEVGRCIKKFVGISCTWSIQMRHLFFSQPGPEGEATVVRRSKDPSFIADTITYHPLKSPSNLYDLHARVQMGNRKKVIREMMDVHSELSAQRIAYPQSDILFPRLKSLYERDLRRWTFVRKKTFYSDLPVYSTYSKVQSDLHKLTSRIESSMQSKSRERIVQFRDINYGYIQEPSESGVSYILDLLFLFKVSKNDGNKKGSRKPARVRRHVYLQTPFLPFQSTIEDVKTSEETIHFILPLTGREEQFVNFIQCYENVILKRSESVKLIIVYFITDESSQKILTDVVQKKISHLERKYPNFQRTLVTLNRMFSRAIGLDIGSNLCSEFDLMLFMDVDITFTAEALRHVRALTEKNRRVYYPIIKSQFKDSGFYWRYYGYGMVALYKGDYDKVKFDKTIVGWGKEDVDLHRRFIKFTSYSIVRSPDPSFVHVYHDVTCSKDLAPDQKRMCESSRSNNYLSYTGLEKIKAEYPTIFEKR